jgi:hypothetical protein
MSCPSSATLPEIEPNAAGIDMAAREFSMAVHADRVLEPVQCFSTFTGDLERSHVLLSKKSSPSCYCTAIVTLADAVMLGLAVSVPVTENV